MMCVLSPPAPLQPCNRSDDALELWRCLENFPTEVPAVGQVLAEHKPKNEGRWYRQAVAERVASVCAHVSGWQGGR